MQYKYKACALYLHFSICTYLDSKLLIKWAISAAANTRKKLKFSFINHNRNGIRLFQIVSCVTLTTILMHPLQVRSQSSLPVEQAWFSSPYLYTVCYKPSENCFS